MYSRTTSTQGSRTRGPSRLPWALKFLWAPFVDRHSSQRFGRRRSLIVPLQLATVALCASLALQSSERTLPFLLSAVLLTNLLAATQDIAADGLAVELLEPRERGLGNGVQVAGYRVGMIIGGGLLLVTFEHIGWTPTFLAMAGVLALATVPIALHREKARSDAEAPRASRLAWLEYARLPGMLPWLVVLVTFKAGDALGGLSAAQLGYTDHFTLSALVGLAAVLFAAYALRDPHPELSEVCR